MRRLLELQRAGSAGHMYGAPKREPFDAALCVKVLKTLKGSDVVICVHDSKMFLKTVSFSRPFARLQTAFQALDLKKK